MTTTPQKHLSLILLFVIMTFTNAQHQSTSSPQPQPFQGLSGNITPSMVIIMVVILIAFSSTAIFSIFLSSCAQVSYAHETAPSSDKSRHRGLDPAVIASFPVFVYADVKELKIGKGALECAVCLSEFEDDDTLRLIPKCTHVFHPECIDAWLASHVTCPVCRATLPSHDETKEIFIELQSNSIRDANSDNVHYPNQP